jgi:chemotaxis methyl-accepting protein methylase
MSEGECLGTPGNVLQESLMLNPLLHRAFRKIVERPFLAISERMWKSMPESWATAGPVRRYFDLVHWVVRRRSSRSQYHATFFLRNRPELALISALAQEKIENSTLRLVVLACSNGAEVYSILWALRSFLPDLKVKVQAVDIAESIVRIAKFGKYSLTKAELMDTPIFERLSDYEIQQLFDRNGDEVTIKPWIKGGIEWRVADASDPGLAEALGPQDIVIANRFLCHMTPPEAERCLRNLSHLVTSGGYLFVSGIDLSIRTKVARELGWKPVLESMQEIHNGDSSIREGWPLYYWGLEPFTKTRRDWQIRYASVFQIGSPSAALEPMQISEDPIA